MAAEKLRDLSQPIDVGLLDATVSAFYGTGSKEERTAAEHILRDLQNNPDMWLQVVHILSNTQNLNTKFFALQVLEGVIKYRWNALPAEQRDGMKNYISEVIVKLSSDEISFRRERLYVNKLNIILVQILKHEWPARWRSFIPDLVAAAKTSETICENCMAILKLLSEEVFDFSRGEMTQQKIKELKQSLNSEFQLIHELCLYVLSASQRAELIRATLATLHAFLSWIPLGYIFESPLLETLLNFFPMPAYCNLTLQCLTEVATLNFWEFYNMQYAKLYNVFMAQLQAIIPPTTNFQEAYANGTSEEQAFIRNLALFFTAFYKSHIRVLESSQENINALLMGLEYLINISYVEETEVFKVCLDYWNSLVLELFEAPHNLGNPAASANMMALQMPILPGMVNGLGSQVLQRHQLYAGPMSKLRLLMICRMAKPEEVLIVEDENGNIVRETMKDNDVLVQYKIMRETLIYLAHLDHEDTEKQMLKKLSKQLSGEDWARNNLNTLCWAIGSISGSMAEEQENRFLVMVIRDLLNLCEITKGKDNKAVIASNIMYVVGQYPRFLRAHWKFLKTVVNKLFEFMHETHPGVQDMACDTFLKIVQKCKRKFVILQVGENEPFVSQLLTTLPATITDLEPHQIHSFYESVGHMIQAESDPLNRDEYLRRLMELPNQKWAEIISQASQSVDFLKDQDVIRAVLYILQTNASVASSLGTYFLPQITLIFLDLLNVYRMCSELISTSIAQGGPYASRMSIVKLLRSVKRETLKLIETFLDKAEDQPQIGKHCVPPMMDPVLGDYARNLPDARESEVLSLFATIINKYKGAMIADVPQIFEAVFQCTLEMITKNFEDYPEHRLKFFSLLRVIATHCFPALIRLSSEQLKLVMDSIIWAFRHTERNIAETGLNLLLEMLKNFQVSELCNQFYRTYFLTIEQEIFAVLTDTFHKPGFKLHVMVLQHLLCLVESGVLTEPLWDVATVPYPYPSNGVFVREYTIKLLSSSFPNMTTTEVTQFVNGLFESRDDLSSFKDHIRDFLVQSKEFSAQEEVIEVCFILWAQLSFSLLQSLNHEKLVAANVQTLLEEKNKLINELGTSRDEEEKSKKALESLASALHEVSSEARDTKEKLISIQVEHENYETQIEDLKLVLEATKEKYDSMLGGAKQEIDALTKSVEQSKHDHQNLKAEWEQKELQLLNSVKKSEEENSSMDTEISRLVNLLKMADEEACTTREEEKRWKSSFKEAESEVIYLKEVLGKAKAESMRLKEGLMDKENELQNILQENEELRKREAASLEKVEELSKLLEEALAEKQVEENREVTDREKDYDMLPKVVKFSEQNGTAHMKPNAEIQSSPEELLVKEKLAEVNDVSNDEPVQKASKDENSNWKLKENEKEKDNSDSAEVDLKMWESCKIEEKDLGPEGEAEGVSFEDELDSKADGADNHDQANGLSTTENVDNGGSSPSKQNSQKKKKALLRKFGNLLKKKGASNQK